MTYYWDRRRKGWGRHSRTSTFNFGVKAVEKETYVSSVPEIRQCEPLSTPSPSTPTSARSCVLERRVSFLTVCENMGRGYRRSILGWMWRSCWYRQSGEGGSPNWTEKLILETKKEHKFLLFWLFLHSHAHFKPLELSSSPLGCKTLETAFDMHSTVHKFTVTSQFIWAQVKEVSLT